MVGRIARLVLLACTLLGLAAMHTIGHHATGHGTGHNHDHAVSQPAAATQHVVEMARATLTAVVPGAEPGGCAGCTPMTLMAHSTTGGMSGWDLCVAVLSSFAVLVLLLVLLLTTVSGRSRPRDFSTGVSRSPRGPPGRSFGLAVTALSVLRI